VLAWDGEWDSFSVDGDLSGEVLWERETWFFLGLPLSACLVLLACFLDVHQGGLMVGYVFTLWSLWVRLLRCLVLCDWWLCRLVWCEGAIGMCCWCCVGRGAPAGHVRLGYVERGSVPHKSGEWRVVPRGSLPSGVSSMVILSRICTP